MINKLLDINPPILLITMIVITVAIRLYLVNPFIVVGNDVGNYLTTMRMVTQDSNVHEWFTRPPLVGYYLLPFTYGLGDILGAKLAGVIASVLPAIPFYFLARRFISDWWSAFASLAFIWLPIYADTLSWGFLSLLVMASLLTVLYFWTKLADADQDIFKDEGGDKHSKLIAISSKRTASALLLGISTGMCAYLNQTMLPPLITFSIIAGLYLAFKNWGLCKYVLLAGFTAVMIALPSLPYFYAHGASGMGSIQLRGFEDIIRGILITALAILFARAVGNKGAVVVALFAIISGTYSIAISADSLTTLTVTSRTLLWTYIPLLLMCIYFVHLAIKRYKVPDDLVTGFGALFIIMMAVSWSTTSYEQNVHNTVITKDSLEALEYVAKNTEEDDIVFVHPYELSYFVGGLANRKYLTTYPRCLTESCEINSDSLSALQDSAVRCTVNQTCQTLTSTTYPSLFVTFLGDSSSYRYDSDIKDTLSLDKYGHTLLWHRGQAEVWRLNNAY